MLRGKARNRRTSAAPSINAAHIGARFEPAVPIGPAAAPVTHWGAAKRRISLLLLLLIAFAAAFSGPLSATPAQAGLTDLVCEALSLSTSGIAGAVEREPEPYIYYGAQFGGGGPNSSGLAAASAADEKEWGTSLPHTAYEWYGLGGMKWSSYYGDDGNLDRECFPIVMVMANNVANISFVMTRALAAPMLMVYQWANDPGLLDFVYPYIDAFVTGRQTCDTYRDPTGNTVKDCFTEAQGLRDTFFFPFLQLAIFLAGLTGMWMLVRKRQREALMAVPWVIIATTLGIVFLNQPTLVPRVVNRQVANLNQLFMTATTGVARNSGSNDMCSLPGAPLATAGIRVSTCQLWATFLYGPWAEGQYGLPTSQVIPSGAAKPGVSRFANVNDLRLTQLDAQVYDHDEMVRMRTNGNISQIRDANLKLWQQVKAEAVDSPYSSDWAGRNPGTRVQYAFLALLGLMIGGIVVFIISFYGLILALEMIMLVFVAPFIALIAIHPTAGRRVGFRWVQALVGIIVKRIGLGLGLAVLMGIYSVIMVSMLPFLGKIILITGSGFALFTMRSLTNDLFTSAGGERGGAGAAVGATIGAAAGATVAVVSGGGAAAAVGGALKGGARGSVIQRPGAQVAGAAGNITLAASQRRAGKEAETARIQQESRRESEQARRETVAQQRHTENLEAAEMRETKRQAREEERDEARRIVEEQRNIEQQRVDAVKASAARWWNRRAAVNDALPQAEQDQFDSLWNDPEFARHYNAYHAEQQRIARGAPNTQQGAPQPAPASAPLPGPGGGQQSSTPPPRPLPTTPIGPGAGTAPQPPGPQPGDGGAPPNQPPPNGGGVPPNQPPPNQPPPNGGGVPPNQPPPNQPPPNGGNSPQGRS